MGYATAERVVLVEKKFEKTFENPLDKFQKCAIIKIQKKRKEILKMEKFDFNVVYNEVSKTTLEMTNLGIIPFSAMADTFEEGRTKALEFAQSISRCYNDNEESVFFFRITVRC